LTIRNVYIPILLLAVAFGASGRAAAQETPPPEPSPVPTPPPPPPPATSGASQTSNYFNPSISLIGNLLGVVGHNPVENLPAVNLRESELGLQAVVDPYARADIFISFGEQGVDVEEGFATFTSLPWKLLVKAGRMRVSFGKTNTLHLHVLPWPDEPLPVVNLLGGEEGWIGTGVSVARLVPLPADLFSELTLQVFDGHSGELFDAKKRSDLAYNAHYRVFAELSEATNVDLGLSYGQGPATTSTKTKTFWTRLEAFDLTLRWKPLQQGSYRSASLRAEVFRSQRDQAEADGGRQTAIGWFVSGEYQLAKRWFVGARVESSDHADNSSLRDTGQAVTLTFWPSEFSQLRTELRRRRYAVGVTATEALLQLQFAIGAHGAHPF
jgi:hypothetical protein